ncbi:hypothetical protein MTY59_45010 [Mycobacterium senriense]|uniref:Uncharacterized protein n=1 Tax=Mycobacterium senriense TaxID=2775496 RepID=A0ABM7T1U6_9MYCO|nr:hypothetical protein MTY59_45010 [Mycobacterium senriense]
MVIGQQETVPAVRGADQRDAKRRLAGEVAHRGTFGSAELLDQPVGFGILAAVEVEVAPLHHRIGGDDLDGLVVTFAEQRREMGMPVDDGVHRVAQPVRVKGSGEGEVQLHRIHVVAVLRGAGVEKQALLQRGQRQDVGDGVLTLQLVDLLLGQAGRRDVRRGEAAPAGTHVCAHTGQGLEPQLTQPGDLPRVENRWRPSPFGVQAWTGAGLDGAGVELDGMRQRHGHRRGRTDQREAGLADAPALARRVARRALPAQVVERDRRVGPGQLDFGVEVTQQAVGQWVRQGPQLLLGVFDHRAQRSVTGHHLRPAQLGDRSRDVQGDRVLGGEPADGAGQVDIGGELLVAPVALDVDADRVRRVTKEFRPGQGEGNQQDVLDSGVERRRHITDQRPGRVGIQLHRQASGGSIGIHLGAGRGQRGRSRRHLLPGAQLVDDVGAVGVFGQHCGPAGERRPRRRQLHRLSGAVHRPCNVEVFQQDPPRHRVDGEVVNDHGQLTCGLEPQRAQHRPGRRVQPRARFQQQLVVQLVHRLQAVLGPHRPGLRYVQGPAAGFIAIDAQPQHRMPIYQGLQHHCDVGLGHPGGRLDHHGLVELIDRTAGAFDALQPPHDRGGWHRADTLVDHIGRPIADGRHPGQPGHGLFDEDVSWPAFQAGGAGPRHHLQRQDAVAAELEERLVDADPLHAEHLGVDAGQDFFDRIARGAILARGVFGCRQRAGVQLAVDRQR